MNEALLDVLREPDTQAELELTADESCGSEVWEGGLRSTLTGRVYPIRSGIPRFVPSANYTVSFGFQWNRFAKVQLDSANGAHFSQARFENETGWSRPELEGKWGLDAGCGCGRFAEVAADFGAQVIALDCSSAIDAAAKNLSAYPNVHCVQGDLLHPPLRKGALQFAYCIGVLQHTPAPAKAVASVLGLITPGGRFAFTVYARRWYTRFYSKYLLRPLTRRLPPQVLMRTIEGAMTVLFPVTSFLFPLPVIGKLAEFTIPVANYVHKNEFPRELRYQEAILDTFDMLAPAYDSPMTAEEVREILEGLGVTDYCFRREVPINVTGAIPALGLPVPGAYPVVKPDVACL